MAFSIGFISSNDAPEVLAAMAADSPELSEAEVHGLLRRSSWVPAPDVNYESSAAGDWTDLAAHPETARLWRLQQVVGQLASSSAADSVAIFRPHGALMRLEAHAGSGAGALFSGSIDLSDGPSQHTDAPAPTQTLRPIILAARSHTPTQLPPDNAGLPGGSLIVYAAPVVRAGAPASNVVAVVAASYVSPNAPSTDGLARIAAVAASLAKTALVRPTRRAGMGFVASGTPTGCNSGCSAAPGAALWIDPADGMAYCAHCWVEQYGEAPLVQPDYVVENSACSAETEAAPPALASVPIST
jgi:hypothetical protein